MPVPLLFILVIANLTEIPFWKTVCNCWKFIWKTGKKEQKMNEWKRDNYTFLTN